MITDADRAIAVAGVMGGQDTSVGADTTRVFLESAHFAPESIIGRARKLGFIAQRCFPEGRLSTRHIGSGTQERKLLAFGRREGQRKLRPEQRRASVDELGIVAGRADLGAQREQRPHGPARAGIAMKAGARIVQADGGINLGAASRQRCARAVADADLQRAQTGAGRGAQPFDHIAIVTPARQGIGGRECAVQRQAQPAVIVAPKLGHEQKGAAGLRPAPAGLVG